MTTPIVRERWAGANGDWAVPRRSLAGVARRRRRRSGSGASATPPRCAARRAGRRAPPAPAAGPPGWRPPRARWGPPPAPAAERLQHLLRALPDGGHRGAVALLAGEEVDHRAAEE